MAKKRKGRSVRKNNQIQHETEEVVQAPHSFVIHKGLTGGHISEVTKDFRKVMEPFTATNLKERKKNAIKDFVSVSGFLHVSHMCIFTRTELGMYLKIAKLPRGPTLTFKMHDFTLAKDVISSLKKQYVYSEVFKHSPLIVLNSFSGEGMHMKLMASTFQNMFPTINLTDINLSNIRRCVLLSYNPTTKLIDFRHYAIKVIPVGISKGVKKVIQGKVPNLARCDDISEFLSKTAILSDSEIEDDPNHRVTLPQNLTSRGNKENMQSAIRLSELGPRMTLQLMKVEDGLLDGEVLFHELVHKTEEEIEAINKKRELKRKLKETRKKQQELNTKKKEEKKEDLKKKSLEGMHKAKERTESDRLMKKASVEANKDVQMEDDDDAEYYRQEVGEEPEKELFSANTGKKRPYSQEPFQNKRQKFDDNKQGKFDRNKSFNKDGKFDRNKSFNKDGKFDKNKSFDKDGKFDRNKSFNKDGKFGGKKPFNKESKFGGKKPFNKEGKFGGNKSFKSGRRSDSSSGKKWPGGRGGNPKYGLKAQEDDGEKSFSDRKPKGKKVLGSKINKNKRR